MIYIYFTNNWGESDSNLLKRMITTTKNDSGIWKNISFTTDLNNANFVVSLGGPPNLNFNKDKVIILQREPTIIHHFNYNDYKLLFSYQRLHHTFTHAEHMQLTYDDFTMLLTSSELCQCAT